jgi:pimeloyl-ACP methyl ester carboxylesterase
VLVGHSLGANIAEYYAGTFGDDLAGVVLIDPGTTEDLLEDFTGTESDARAIARCGWKCAAAAAAANLGVVRLATRKAGAKHMSPDDAAVYRAELALRHNATSSACSSFFPNRRSSYVPPSLGSSVDHGHRKGRPRGKRNRR